MEKVTVSKLDPLGKQSSDGIIIEILNSLPKYTSNSTLDEFEKFYADEAEKIINALMNNLPQGTLFRVAYGLMEKYVKETLYRGKHMDKHQFHSLIQELQTCKNEIIEKLEEIRCGIIDVETEVEKGNKQD